MNIKLIRMESMEIEGVSGLRLTFCYVRPPPVYVSEVKENANIHEVSDIKSELDITEKQEKILELAQKYMQQLVEQRPMPVYDKRNIVIFDIWLSDSDIERLDVRLVVNHEYILTVNKGVLKISEVIKHD